VVAGWAIPCGRRLEPKSRAGRRRLESDSGMRVRLHVDGVYCDSRVLITTPAWAKNEWHARDARTGAPATGLKLPARFEYAQLLAASDNRTLVFAQSRNVDGSDNRVRLWDLLRASCCKRLLNPGNRSAGPDGRSFLTYTEWCSAGTLPAGRSCCPTPRRSVIAAW